MRGKGLVDRAAVIIKGITPAYAGKSNAIVEGIKNLPDHPRLCGEKFFCVHRIISDTGITPAYAGKRRSSIR